MTRPKVLICPLNWGLGHATRCIPIIDQFLEQDFEVEIATDGVALRLLEAHYPQLKCHRLPSYDIRYPSHGNMLFKMALQVPKLIKAVISEHKWIRKWSKANPDALILSDNRFGCFSFSNPSIYLTHQIQIMPPQGMEFLRFISYPAHKLVFSFFDEVWVPDHPQIQLAGKLSHFKTAKKYHSIGLLSRFQHQAVLANPQHDLLMVLSGPEPQRTLLENQLLGQISTWLGSGKSAILVRGTPGQELPNPPQGLKVYSHCSSQELQSMMCNSKRILCRSGYSTLMDLCQLSAKAILIPTPGQTEQEYLAYRAKELNWAPMLSQNELDLSQLPELDNWRGFRAPAETHSLLIQNIQRLKEFYVRN